MCVADLSWLRGFQPLQSWSQNRKIYLTLGPRLRKHCHVNLQEQTNSSNWVITLKCKVFLSEGLYEDGLTWPLLGETVKVSMNVCPITCVECDFITFQCAYQIRILLNPKQNLNQERSSCVAFSAGRRIEILYKV